MIAYVREYQRMVFDLSEEKRKKIGSTERGTISKAKFRVVKVEGHPDRRLFISQALFRTMIPERPYPFSVWVVL
jgi:hypothetical protein